MSKAVLISIQPQWCELILRGKKTVEVRKSRPKLKPPFKCYIYCTKPQKKFWYHGEYYSDILYVDFYSKELVCGCTMADDFLNGKVIGEFVCDDITLITQVSNMTSNTYEYRAVSANGTLLSDDIFENSCLSKKEIEKYLDGRKGYAWHISELVIYDKPKELREFYSLCNEDCTNCEMWQYVRVNADEYDMDCSSEIHGHKPLKRPPQSWCYVEEVDNDD
ncbi:MAG: ASCH domain-containing protein [Oscillospiraceae bacterium]